MCRVERRIYVRVDGHRSTFEDTFPCDKAPKGRLCDKVKRRTTEYHPKNRSLSPHNDSSLSLTDSPTSVGNGTHLVQQRRPPKSSKQHVLINVPWRDEPESRKYPPLIWSNGQGYVPLRSNDSPTGHDLAEYPTMPAFSWRPEVTVPQDSRGASPMRRRNSLSLSNIGQQELIDARFTFSDDSDSHSDVSSRTRDKHSSAHAIQSAETVIGEEAVQSNMEITETGSPERVDKESWEESDNNESQKDQKWETRYTPSVVFNTPLPRSTSSQQGDLLSRRTGREFKRKPSVSSHHPLDRSSDEPASRYFEASPTSPDSRYGSTTLMQAVGSRQYLPHNTKLDSEVAHAVVIPPPISERESDAIRPIAAGAAPEVPPDDCDDEDVQPAIDINLNDQLHSRHFVEHEDLDSLTSGFVALPNIGDNTRYTSTGSEIGGDGSSKHGPWKNIVLSGPAYWKGSHGPSHRARSLSVSSVSSYANSVLSTASLASSATDMSKHSGYSAIQIAVATKELISILSNDEILAPLYQRAIHDVSIGPEKLERNLRRMIRNYGKHLGQDPGDTLELLASRLVQLKAKEVARSIVQKYKPMTFAMKVVDTNPNQEMSSSEEETDNRDVDESIFQDIALLREFLTSREPLEALRSQIRSFVIPKSERTAITAPPTEKALAFETMSENHSDTIERAPATSNSSPSLCAPISTVKETTEKFFVAVGLLDPPLMPGFSRLRWKCGLT
ncbi:hypothetical protein FB567DRAFT_243716 [Paraphoma chrysanthemicola]|uniref:Uncharacterized protein n=1 Tax=Paraphoma chrysanthemicola TaxID=798071 RepID=A0A8K0QT50_9PLEO|nr:hypothetical protein FB567DRAFT_243716 [Paraphoma chrysanthemicola]